MSLYERVFISTLLAALAGAPASAEYYGNYYSGYFQRRESPPPVVSLSLDPQDILNSAFRIAAREERLDDMKRLLAQKADINACSDEGETALMYASRNCSTPIVKALLTNDADVNLQDREGRTALIYAAQDSCAPVIQILLMDPKTRLRQKDNFGKAAIDYARENASLDVAGPPIAAIQLLNSAYLRKTHNHF
jgi:ankyrin repeat protein